MPMRCQSSTNNERKSNVNMPTVQPKPAPPSNSSAPRLRPPCVYFVCVAFCCVAFALLAFFASRGPNGLFRPEFLKARLYATSRWAHGALTGATLVFLAVEFDCIGRFLAFMITRIGFAGTMTRLHLTSIRIVILLAMLALVIVEMILGVCPVPRRSFLPVVFGALAAPVALSVVERMRTRS